MFVFSIVLTAIVECLRLLLGTHLGRLVTVIAIVIGLLWLLYLAMKTVALVGWEVSGMLAQLIEHTYRQRISVKESNHATRLL